MTKIVLIFFLEAFKEAETPDTEGNVLIKILHVHYGIYFSSPLMAVASEIFLVRKEKNPLVPRVFTK